MRCRLLLVVAALAGGCHWDLHDPGTDPKPAQLYFPSGIAMDPGRRYAYVSNGNADLRYGGGTIQIVDMLAFECTVAVARQQLLADQTPPSGACGDAATWTQAVSDARCALDPLDPSIVDCDETPFILQTSTVRVGNFAGAIRVVKTGDRTRRLFVAVRGDPSVTFIDVDLVDDPAAAAPGVVLDCYDHPDTVPAQVGYDPAAHTIKAPAACDVDHLVQQFQCMGLPTCQLGDDSKKPGQTQLPVEPFGMQIDQSNPDQPRLLVSHQATGQVSVVDIRATPTLLSTSSPFFTADATGRHGAFGLAKQPTSSLWFMTSNVQPQIATFRVADADVVVGQSTIGISGTFTNGADLRDIQFDPSGLRAFVTENNPPSLLVLDTSPNPANGDLPRNVIATAVDVCQTPSHMGVRRMIVAGAPGTPPRSKTKIVVPCFLSSQVMIVDPDRPGVDDTVFSGLGGPNEIAFNFGNADDPNADADLDPTLAAMGSPPPHGYVTNFTESTIAVVDLAPGSPTENRVIARLGFPPGGFNP